MVGVVCHMTKRNLCFSLMTGKVYILFFLFPVLVEVQQYQSKGALHVSWQVLCWIQACFFFSFFHIFVISSLNCHTLISVSIFSILFSIHFLWCWQGEFVEQSQLLGLAIFFFIFIILIYLIQQYYSKMKFDVGHS